MAAIIAASTYSSSAELHETVTYPETRSEQVAISAVREPGAFVGMHTSHHKLVGFARHASVADGVRGRVREFEVQYHAPNRNPAVPEPYLPTSIPDRLMIKFNGDVFIEETIPQQFSGTLGHRSVEVAQLRVKNKSYLLVTSNSAPTNPLWLAIFSTSGELMYRAATPHGGYRFVENADGISMVDDAGYGKRITLL